MVLIGSYKGMLVDGVLMAYTEFEMFQKRGAWQTSPLITPFAPFEAGPFPH